MRSTAAVVVLEESPRFNAGKGAVFNAEGRHELDASIMEGHTRRAGAVAGVTTVRNPIKLARAVMEHSPHVMLAGAGAEAFADTRPDIERVPNDWFDTDKRRKQLETGAGRSESSAGASDRRPSPARISAPSARSRSTRRATSPRPPRTGGMTNKSWGRVGDSPMIGAGTWADERCGVSGTGWGEFYIRNAVAHDICARVAYRGDTLAGRGRGSGQQRRARARRRRRRDRARRATATSPCRSTPRACTAAGSSPDGIARHGDLPRRRSETRRPPLARARREARRAGAGVASSAVRHASMACFISSGRTSPTCVPSVHLWPNGSITVPMRSPQNSSLTGRSALAPALTARSHAASASGP